MLEFLSAIFDKGHAYSTTNSAKCASTIVHIPPYNSLSKHPLINRYITGIFNLRPLKPKLSFLWDMEISFRYFKQQGDNCLLSDIILTQKLIVLLLLLGVHRLKLNCLVIIDYKRVPLIQCGDGLKISSQ